jgi:hypothetical protein
VAGQGWVAWKALLAAGFRLILPFASRSQVVQGVMLAESHLTRRLFGSMVRRIDALAVATG